MNRPSSRRPVPSRDRRGSITVLVAALLIVFLATVAFSVDVAYMQLSRAELRAATDAAARAGGEALSRLQDQNEAIRAAKAVARANLVGGVALELDDADIVFGNTTMSHGGVWAFTPGAEPTNSLRLTGRKTRGSASGSVNTFFGKLFGVQDFEPILSTTVTRLDRDIVLAVDRSSSMKLDLATTAPVMSGSDSRFGQKPDCSNSRWGAATGAIKDFVSELDRTQQTEYLGIVTWASNYTAHGVTNLESELNQPLSSDAAAAEDAMDDVGDRVFNGMTNPHAGITTATAELLSNRARPFAAKTLVVLTDGQRTAGPNSVAAAEAAAAAGITVHTITYGAVFDITEMQQVAAAGGGKHWHAPNAGTLRQIFKEIALTVPVVITE